MKQMKTKERATYKTKPRVFIWTSTFGPLWKTTIRKNFLIILEKRKKKILLMGKMAQTLEGICLYLTKIGSHINFTL